MRVWAIRLTSCFVHRDPIHPRYKQEVGRRLAQAVIGARYAQYGGVHYSGPKFVDAYPLAIAPEANNGVKGYRLTFENGNGGAAPATLHSSAVSLPLYFRICISVTPTGDQTD